jgi:glyoxylase-like metal-dependent hydrolase (beta-lactamase superfamily II)
VIEPIALAPDLVQFRSTARAWPSSCNVYLLRDGDASALVDTGLGVDPGLAALRGEVERALGRWGQRLRDIRRIVLTHTHTDHAGGTIPLARETGACVIVPARGWAQAADLWWQVHHIFPDDVRRKVGKYRDFDAEAHFRELTMPETFSQAAGIDFEHVDEGAEVVVGRHRLRAHHMPGHDVAHLAWVDASSGLAFTGDLMMARGTSLPWYPPNAGGIGGYVDSLARLATLPIELACPGHHHVIRGRDEVVALCRRTVATIADRSRRLLARLLEGPAPFAELDDLVYDAAVRDVIPWASSVTDAHLCELQREGVVAARGDGSYVAEPVAAARCVEALGMLPAARIPDARVSP